MTKPINWGGLLAKYMQPLKERATILPLGQYEDGSVGLAWPKALADPVEAGYRSANTPLPPVNDDEAWRGKAVDMFNVTSLAPMGAGLAGGVVDNAVGSAGGNLMKGASDLPMDLASRMARAREMGFDTDRVLYHGASGQDFDAFRPSRSGEFGPGAYFSTEPKEASSYAMSQHAGNNPRVLPVHTRANLLPVSSPDEFWSRFGGPGVSDEQAVQRAIDAGYGGVEFTRPLDYWDDATKSVVNTGEMQTHVNVFDPRNIRSVNAAFDPSKSDSANLLAANSKDATIPGLLANVLDEPKGIRAYHGSPHDFDRFDLSKVGTGQGASQRGRGVNLAANEEMARQYRDALSEPLGKQGHMYEVNISAQPDQFLDLDAPLYKQPPKVQEALKAAGVWKEPPRYSVTPTAKGDKWTVRNVYGDAVGTFKSEQRAMAAAEAGTDRFNKGSGLLAYTNLGGNTVYGDLDGGGAAKKLRDLGVVGTRTSAGKHDETFVVFDDQLIDILRKYSNAPTGSIPGLAAQTQEQDPQTLTTANILRFLRGQ